MSNPRRRRPVGRIRFYEFSSRKENIFHLFWMFCFEFDLIQSGLISNNFLQLVHCTYFSGAARAKIRGNIRFPLVVLKFRTLNQSHSRPYRSCVGMACGSDTSVSQTTHAKTAYSLNLYESTAINSARTVVGGWKLWSFKDGQHVHNNTNHGWRRVSADRAYVCIAMRVSRWQQEVYARKLQSQITKKNSQVWWYRTREAFAIKAS